MIRVREKAYSDYSGLLGYDTISMGVVLHVPASSKVKTFKTSRTTDAVTQHYIPEDLILRNSAVKTENPSYY
jgi:hypothetical protein